jgi:deoxycytidylate deaminase
MKLIIAAGITEVYFYYWYPDGLTDKLVEASDIKLIQMEDE